MGFYSTAADVIVVLMLMTAVEARYYRFVPRMGFGWNLLQAGGFAVVVNGLVQALRTLQQGKPTRFLGYSASAWIWWAVGLQLLIVAAIALRGGRDFETLKRPAPSRTGLWIRKRGAFISLNVLSVVFLVVVTGSIAQWGGYALIGTIPATFAWFGFCWSVTRGGPDAQPRWPRWLVWVVRSVRDVAVRDFLK